MPLVVTRKPRNSLTPVMIGKIRAPDPQNALIQATGDKTGKDFGRAVQEFAARTGPCHGIRGGRCSPPPCPHL